MLVYLLGDATEMSCVPDAQAAQAVLLQRARERTRVCESVATRLPPRPRSTGGEELVEGSAWRDVVLRRKLQRPDFLARAGVAAAADGRAQGAMWQSSGVTEPLHLLRTAKAQACSVSPARCVSELGAGRAASSLLQRRWQGESGYDLRRPAQLLRVGAEHRADHGAMRALLLEDFVEMDAITKLQGLIRRQLILWQARRQRCAAARWQAAISIQKQARRMAAKNAALHLLHFSSLTSAALCIQRAVQCKRSRAALRALVQLKADTLAQGQGDSGPSTATGVPQSEDTDEKEEMMDERIEQAREAQVQQAPSVFKRTVFLLHRDAGE